MVSIKVTLLISFSVVSPAALYRAPIRAGNACPLRAPRAEFPTWASSPESFRGSGPQIQQFMNRSSAAEACAGALDAALTLIERDLRPLLSGRGRWPPIPPADSARRSGRTRKSPHQPLCQNAVQSRDKDVGLHAHVQEAPEHVDHVVGVDGSEHQGPVSAD